MLFKMIKKVLLDVSFEKFAFNSKWPTTDIELLTTDIELHVHTYAVSVADI